MSSIIGWLAVSSALGFAPTADTRAEPQRVRWQHADTQGLLQGGAAWQRFVATDGAGWQARFDEATGTPRFLWGGGIPIGGATPDQVLQQLRALLDRHRDLFGFEALDPGVAHYDPAVDTWYVSFAPLRDGTPTYRGTISARIKHGNLILLTVGTAPRAPLTGRWTLSAADAIQAAIAGGPAPSAIHTDPVAVRELLERQDPHGLVLERTWEVRTRTADPPGIWVSFVRASDGEVLHVHNDLRFFDGVVDGLHHARTVDQPPSVTSPMPFVTVAGDVDDDLTDLLGEFTVSDGAPYSTDLHGDYLTVDNAAGDDGVLSGNGPELRWTDADATQAEIDTYVSVHDVRLWGERVAGPIGMVTDPLTAYVNVNDVCNAFFDPLTGDITFYAAGSGCSNMGQISDVVYHEWGHGFHFTILQGGVYDGSVGEAAGDTVSMFMTGDPTMAPYFFTDGGPVRDLSPDHVYPDDLVGEVHEDGLIFGGTMWDLRQILEDDLGAEVGTETAESLFAGILRAGPTLPETYYEALVADDDDGNLANGTPNDCRIFEAFDRHGLSLVGRYLPSHDPLDFTQENKVTEVVVTLTQTALACAVGVPDRADLHYRVDTGPWEEVAATVNGSTVSGYLPALPLGSFVEYWVSGGDTDGAVWRTPSSGEWAPYTVYVGEAIPIRCEDFEASDGGFTHQLLAGEDDWQWGAPAGSYSDPSAAYSGSNVWGNDLDGDGKYSPVIESRLVGATWDTLWYTDVLLQYRRWLTVEDGFYDRALITANDQPVWINHDSGSEAGGEHHRDEQWVSHVVDLRGIADQTQVTLGWELRSDEGLEFGGWNIDDVCLYAAPTRDNRLAIGDFVVEDLGGPIGLSWTNPSYGTVAEVVVVRRVDDWPTSHEDGDLIVDLTAPVLGEAVEEVHQNVDGASGFYAVYASDGDEWLSWTVEGWNAGHADPNEGGPATTTPTDTDPPVDTDDPGDEPPPEGSEPATDKGGGCGCDAAGGSGALWPWAALFWLGARRRRSPAPPAN